MLTLLAIDGEVGGRERVERARAKPSQCVHVSQILKLRKRWNSSGPDGAPRVAVGLNPKKKNTLRVYAVELSDILSPEEEKRERSETIFAALDDLINMELSSIGEQVFAVEAITKKRIRKVRTLLCVGKCIYVQFNLAYFLF